MVSSQEDDNTTLFGKSAATSAHGTDDEEGTDCAFHAGCDNSVWHHDGFDKAQLVRVAAQPQEPVLDKWMRAGGVEENKKKNNSTDNKKQILGLRQVLGISF